MDLKTIYTAVHAIIRWPKPIPDPAQINIKWTKRRTIIPDRCGRAVAENVIEISDLYKDERLLDELMDLMTHLVGHFVWEGHPPAFTQFLREVGVSEAYAGNKMRPTLLYRCVRGEKAPLRYTWMCPACGGTRRTNFVTEMWCRRCSPPSVYDLRFQLIKIKGPMAELDRQILESFCQTLPEFSRDDPKSDGA